MVSTKLEIHICRLPLLILLDTEFGDTLLGMEVGRIVTDDFFVDLERIFPPTFLEVVLA